MPSEDRLLPTTSDKSGETAPPGAINCKFACMKLAQTKITDDMFRGTEGSGNDVTQDGVMTLLIAKMVLSKRLVPAVLVSCKTRYWSTDVLHVTHNCK